MCSMLKPGDLHTHGHCSISISGIVRHTHPVFSLMHLFFILFSVGAVKFIDYEYADFNYQAYDIGNHFNEFAGKKSLY